MSDFNDNTNENYIEDVAIPALIIGNFIVNKLIEAYSSTPKEDNMSYRDKAIEVMRKPGYVVVDCLTVLQEVTGRHAVTTNDAQYRDILRLLWKLQKEGILGTAHFAGSNQRVWWLTERLK